MSAVFSSDPVQLLRQALLQGLQSGRWAAGERLPTERELCEHYQVGRSALRRVLGEFKASGLIEQRVGSGTYVAEGAQERMPAHPQAQAVSPAELMEARLLLEPLLVDLVVSKATAVDFDAMADCCDRAEAASSLEEFEHWDGALHAHIARATHNSFFMNVYRLVTEARDRGEWGQLKRKSVTPERRATYQREHRELVDALRERDADRARKLATEHLLRVRHNLLGRL